MVMWFFHHSDKAFCSVENKLTVMQISRSSFSAPTDVTLKLSDGSIDAHRMILAAVSPVFEKMFYGDFKEGKSSEVALPSDSYKVMKLMIDFVYNGTFELKGIDEVLPLLEVIERYQMKKTPFQHMIDEVVLTKLDSSNYVTLLPKFASVMSKKANKKAAEAVLTYVSYCITKSHQSIKLPEEVLLPLLQKFALQCHDAEIFDFLIKWHNHQTKTLGKSLQLTSKLFEFVRYSLIVPQILTSKVARCNILDKQLIANAVYYIYNSHNPLGEYSNDDPCKPTFSCFSRKPTVGSKIEWVANNDVTIAYNPGNEISVSGTLAALPDNGFQIVRSKPLSDGIYSFSVSNSGYIPKKHGMHSNRVPIKLCVAVTRSTVPETHLYANVLEESNLVTLNVYRGHLFIKCIANFAVTATFSTSFGGPFCIHILKYKKTISSSSSVSSFSFDILVRGKPY